MDSLRREIIHNIRMAGMGGPIPEAPPSHSHLGGRDSPTYPGSYAGPPQGDLEHIKREIIQGLRMEVRELAREINAQQSSGPSGRGLNIDPSSIVPPTSDLYQTHLYTQL